MTEVGALFLGAVFAGVAALIALWGVITARIIARRQTTIEFIHRQQADRDIIAARRQFIQLANDDGALAKFAAKDKEGTEEMQAIQIVLNQFEILSIGIQRGILDFEIWRRWNRSSTLLYWGHAAPFVHALRTRVHNEALYHEFEQLASWLKDKDSKMPVRHRWSGLWF